MKTALLSVAKQWKLFSLGDIRQKLSTNLNYSLAAGFNIRRQREPLIHERKVNPATLLTQDTKGEHVA